MKYIVKLIVFLLLVSCYFQCKKSDSKVFTLSGYVVNESGIGVGSAEIVVDGHSVLSKSDGTFKIVGLPNKDMYRLSVNAGGYFTGYKNIENIDGSNLFAPVTLISKVNLGSIPSEGGVVGTTGFKVVAPANAFINADGTPYAGQVAVAARYIRQDNPFLSNLMPGGDFLAQEGSNVGAMISYGFIATEFTDASGQKLTPNANVKAAVTVPAGAGNPVVNGAKAWSYDSGLGKWNNSTDVTQTGSEYFFPCTTLYQNLDKFVLGFSTIEGQVVCTNGTPVFGAEVTLASTQYNNRYTTYTNENGKYRAKVAVQDGSVTFNYNVSVSGSSVYVGTAPLGGTVTAPNITTTNCSSGNGGDNNNSGSGQFTYSGNTYTGDCESVSDVNGSGGIDVLIASASGTAFAIYNMPQQSSGTYNFTDVNVTLGSSSLYALCNLTNGHQLQSKNGTLTKTRNNSFTFTCTMYYDLEPSKTYNVTGRGNY